jgi:preprotein translocase subunit SecG
VFGARGTSTLFSRLTAVFAALFFVTSLTLAYVGTRSSAEPTTVLERAAQSAATASPAPTQPSAPQGATAPAPPAAAPAPDAPPPTPSKTP